MKKTYITPDIYIEKVSNLQMIAQSNISVSDDKAIGNYEGGGDVKEEKIQWDDMW